ncbi:MAG: DUF3006 domain-containing protein [Clostridiales bacterium]|nr:DUF3006 domain-containing protein [Clostridiales bacterium]
MERLVIDRIEKDLAVCENGNGEQVKIELSEIPFECYEGMILTYEEGVYSHSLDEEEKRRREIYELQKNLFNK